MEKLPETMKALEADGVSIGVLVKYNIPSYPFYTNASQQTDMVSDVYHVSYYATSAPYGETLSDDYINGLADKKYLSPDKMIDASTCIFPDKTWFIRDISHDPFPPSIDKLIKAFIDSHGVMTVFSNEAYPQFLQYYAEADTITPIEAEEPAGNTTGFMKFINDIVRFFKSFFNVIKNLFTK